MWIRELTSGKLRCDPVEFARQQSEKNPRSFGVDIKSKARTNQSVRAFDRCTGASKNRFRIFETVKPGLKVDQISILKPIINFAAPLTHVFNSNWKELALPAIRTWIRKKPHIVFAVFLAR